MPTHTLPRSSMTTLQCPTCSKLRSRLAYARASEVSVFTPAYHQLAQGLLIAAYQYDQITRFRRLLDYDRVLDWARTTRNAIVGIARHKSRHPLRCYLNEVDPSTTNRSRWEVYLSACEALKHFRNMPHDRALTIFESFDVQPTGVIFTVYHPLPTWTVRVLTRLHTLPTGQPITRDQFISMLHARA
jgi:hypothetical protein